jgi:putative transposase
MQMDFKESLIRFMKQIELKFSARGGKRRGAGRKPKNGVTAGVPHASREPFKARHPVHVTMRMLPGVGFLRGFSRRRAIENALREAKLRFGMRLVHYSIQGNHLHLIVELDDPSMFSRSIQGLAIRLARALNRLASRTGKVFADRFHSHVMMSLREVMNAVRYVLLNFRHHLREDVAPEGVDPCSSAVWRGEDGPVSAPRTWLLRAAEPPLPALVGGMAG